MAKRAIEVRACDRCGVEPANTWLITGPDGLVRETELCDRHAAPVANLYALARPVVSAPTPARPTRRRAPAVAPVAAPEPEPVWR